MQLPCLSLVHFQLNPCVRLVVSPNVATSVSILSLLPFKSASPVQPLQPTALPQPASPPRSASVFLHQLARVVCSLTGLVFWLIFYLIPWLLEFHAVWFSGASGCLLILDWLLSSFWTCKEVKDFYLCLHLGQNYLIVLQVQLSPFPTTPATKPCTVLLHASPTWSCLLWFCPCVLYTCFLMTLPWFSSTIPLPLPLWLLSVLSLFQCLWLHFACLIACWLGSTDMWHHMVFVFHCLAYFI